MKKDTRGFSLIELMVVISIIGILSVISITALTAARDRSRASSALSTASGIVPAATLCADEARDAATEGVDPPPHYDEGRSQARQPGSSDYICKNTDVDDGTWPELPSRYAYGDASDGGTNPDDWYFTIVSEGDSDNIRVACDSTGCKDCKESPDSGPCERALGGTTQTW